MWSVVARMMKIEIGGGATPIPGYVNCDIRELDSVAYVIKDNRLPFKDRSVDEIISIHCLEHLERSDGQVLLGQCFRVLKSGGVFVLAVPCMDMIASSFNRDLKTALKHIFGTDAFPENHHQTFYTRAELIRALSEVGFKHIAEEQFAWPNKHVVDWTVQLRAIR
jgi:predicted SAM-dependent methyltransferase